MNHCGTQTLETKRLILRRFALNDAEAMYKNWCSDGEVTKFLTWPPHASASVSRAILEKWVANYAADHYYQWAIVPKELGEPIGSIAAVKMDDDVSMVHIGYCIGRPWWHRGYTSEALQSVMDFFFDTVGVNRIESEHDPENPRSGMVMQKCGMKYEGTLRRAVRSNRGIHDACWYALVREDRK